ncbi:MAG: M43 family zinc metalloprotease [Bacteroidota bacterium]
MKTLLSTLSFTFVIAAAIGQNNWCKTDQIQQELLQNNPGFAEHMHKAMSKAASGNGALQKATLYVPVVVHIIHDNGIGNISAAQVNDAIRVLNEDFNRQNSDAGNTRNTGTAPFSPIAGDLDVKFVLAKKDPQGNCTNGIVRVNAPHLTYNANDDCKYAANGGSDQWPMDQYLNLWVINSIESDGAGMTLGYAYLPYWPSGTDYGILMRHDYFGTIESAVGSDGRTLTHEMGHLLGLQHIFEDGWSGATGCHATDCNQNGDYACDTPPQAEANWSCSPTWNSCPEVPTNDAFGFDALDQIENYMSYNACQNMFSIDQLNIIQNNFIDIDFMADMVAAGNVLATGINEPAVLCKADFEASKQLICNGETIQFTDFSYDTPDNWVWTVQGTEGTDWVFVNSTNTNSQNPTIQFLNAGNYTVELLASSTSGSDTELKTNYIKVLPNASALPYFEGFENYISLNGTNQWAVENYGANAQFEITATAAHSGSKSVKLANFNQDAGNYDELISAPIDLSTVLSTENVTLSFRYAYHKRFADNDEWLKVFISGNCGEDWAQRKTLHGSQLSAVTSTSAWTASAGDWVTVHMTNVTPVYFTSSFMMKFKFESDGGNNFFLDDINLYNGDPSDNLIVGIIEGSTLESLSLYPNPAEEELSIAFDIATNTRLPILITDLLGKSIQSFEIEAAQGKNVVQVNTSALNSGVYLVRIGEAVKSFIVK